MMASEKIVYCDECKKEFAYQSIQIKETSVEIAGDVLLLDYYTCPFCNAVYKVLFVEEVKYRELLDDYISTEKRIRRQQGKDNPMPLQKLQKMAFRKRGRIRAYVEGVSKKYPGSFVLATENNQQGEHIMYLPREGAEMKGEK